MRPLGWRLIAAALGRRIPERHLPSALGDLLEDHASRAARVGRVRAGAWLFAEAFSMWRAYRPPAARPRAAAGGRRVAALLESARLPPIARRLAREPGFSIVAVATLALCLAGNLTILAVLDAVLLRPLPFPEPERLVSVFNTYPRAGVPDDGCSVANYYERRGRIPALASISLYREGASVVGESGATRVEPVIRVSPEFFETLGTPPATGRSFSEDETARGNDHVAIVTPGFWRRYGGGVAPALGRRLRLDGEPVTVVGILPDGFRFLSSEAGLFLPLASSPDDRLSARRHWGSSDMVARLAPGASLDQAQAQVDAQNRRLETASPDGRRMAEAGFRSIVKPLHAYHLAGAERSLLLTQAGAALLLVVGAVNLANLMLVRSGRRAREWAVRRAIGAGARHVVADLVAETLLLSLAGGALALPLAAAGVRLATALGAERLPLGTRIGLDPWLAVAGLGGAVALGAAIGGPVGWLSFRARLASALRAGARGTLGGRGARRVRAAFATAQVALALVLLSGAGLLSLSFRNALAVAPGFRPEGVVSGQVLLPLASHPDGLARLRFAEAIVEELEGEPGVATAGLATNLPLSGRNARSAATVAGRVLETPRGRFSYGVGGSYFEAMGFTLREGRFLTAADSRSARRVCVVDEAFARDYWPSGGALGHAVFPGSSEGEPGDGFTIVGVVAPAKQADVTEDGRQGAVYFPFGYWNDGLVYVVARGSLAGPALGAALRGAVRRVDPELPVDDVASMPERIAKSLSGRRSPAFLGGAFAALALLLTGLGTYGLLSYAVSERRREIGVRMALGARPGQVRRQFLGSGLRLLAGGMLLGIPGAWAAGMAMRGLLFGVTGSSLPPLAAAVGAICLLTLAACLVPSERAARTAPTEVLAE